MSTCRLVPTFCLKCSLLSQEYVCEETGDEVVLMKDRAGRVIGSEKLNFSTTWTQLEPTRQFDTPV